ncbi:hypothetical protein [Isoptericola hypogeus]|uniref:hypothetical protein n=1 Tax=Isoptericola hypogeus TaxID=300179 RepID=UPI0031D8F420
MSVAPVQLLYRVLMVVQMAGALVLAAGIEPVFVDRDFTVGLFTLILLGESLIASSNAIIEALHDEQDLGSVPIPVTVTAVIMVAIVVVLVLHPPLSGPRPPRAARRQGPGAPASRDGST